MQQYIKRSISTEEFTTDGEQVFSPEPTPGYNIFDPDNKYICFIEDEIEADNLLQHLNRN